MPAGERHVNAYAQFPSPHFETAERCISSQRNEPLPERSLRFSFQIGNQGVTALRKRAP